MDFVKNRFLKGESEDINDNISAAANDSTEKEPPKQQAPIVPVLEVAPVVEEGTTDTVLAAG